MYLNGVIKTTVFFMSLLVSVNVFGFDFKVNGFYYKITSREELTVSLTAPDYRGHYEGDIVIPEYVTYNKKKYHVTALDEKSFRGCTFLKSLTIPKSIVSIEAPFMDCHHIQSVTLHCKNVINNMFYEKNSLEKVTLGEGVETVGAKAFYHCLGIKSLTISNTVKSIEEYAFDSCMRIDSVTIPSSVKRIGDNAFYGCKNMTELVISEGVEKIGSYAFMHCERLYSITIPYSIKEWGNKPFENCNLRIVNVPKHYTIYDLYKFGNARMIKKY